MPFGAEASPTTTGNGTTSSNASSIPATVLQQQQGNPLLKNYQTPTSPTSTTPISPQQKSSADSGLLSGDMLPLTLVAFMALAVAAVSLAFTAKSRGRKLKDRQ
jgi:hypothetical protein